MLKSIIVKDKDLSRMLTATGLGTQDTICEFDTMELNTEQLVALVYVAYNSYSVCGEDFREFVTMLYCHSEE
jgi:hypothetical protein